MDINERIWSFQFEKIKIKKETALPGISDHKLLMIMTFEPRSAEPESAMIPLHYRAKLSMILFYFNEKK